MGRWAIISVFVIAVASAAATALIAREKQIFDLQCSFGSERYAFHVEIPKYLGTPHVIWARTNSTFDLDVWRLDETNVVAVLAQKLSGWPDRADLMSFDFNRLTGDAEIDYLHKPSADEQKSDPDWLRGDPLVLTDLSQRGNCTKSKPVF